MALVAVTHQSWLFGPPLDRLRLRLANGRFDSLRPRVLDPPPRCATSQVVPADHPDNPTGRDVTVANGLTRRSTSTPTRATASSRRTAAAW